MLDELTEKKGVVRSMAKNDLDQVLAWRNHREIRRHMYTSHEITRDEHFAWFERESKNDKKHLLIFEYDNVASGFVSFNLLQPGGTAEWGFYVAPESPKGIARIMGITSLQHAYNDLNLHKIMGYVLESNQKSIRYHLKLGFIQEGIFREHFFNGKEFQNVIYFGALKNEWLSRTI